jgi:hypothetical protein
LVAVAKELKMDISHLTPHLSADDAEISMLIMRKVTEIFEISGEQLIDLCKTHTLTYKPPICSVQLVII